MLALIVPDLSSLITPVILKYLHGVLKCLMFFLGRRKCVKMTKYLKIAAVRSKSERACVYKIFRCI